MTKQKSEASDILLPEEKRQAKTIYRMRGKFLQRYPHAVTLVKGKRVALCGESVTVEVPGSRHKPPEILTVPGATQAELKHLLEIDGNPMIEKVEE